MTEVAIISVPLSASWGLESPSALPASVAVARATACHVIKRQDKGDTVQ